MNRTRSDVECVRLHRLLLLLLLLLLRCYCHAMSFNQITKPFNLFHFDARKKLATKRQNLRARANVCVMPNPALLFGRDIKLHLVRSCRLLHLHPTSTGTFFR